MFRSFLIVVSLCCWLSVPQTTTDSVGQEVVDKGCIPISEIQGNTHSSPYIDQDVCTKGVVTYKYSRGFYLQTPTDQQDDDESTSEAILVFTQDRPEVVVGDAVLVQGFVSEYVPGGERTFNLPTTQLSPDNFTILSLETLFPNSNGEVVPVVIGSSGRIPPILTIFSSTLDVYNCSQELSCPELDLEEGLDFYEAIEAMLVTFEDPIVVGPTNRFGETFMVVNRGEQATGMNSYGGINIVPFVDFNPERVQVQGSIDSANMGATLEGDVTGVISYAFGNFEMFPTMSPVLENNEPEVVPFFSDNFKIATYNILNYNGDNDIQTNKLVSHIIELIDSPDIIALQEVQDNSGNDDDGVVDSDVVLDTLVSAIALAGGRKYKYVYISPVDGFDGGIPGGNIRNAYLYDPETVYLAESVEGTTGGTKSDVEVVDGPMFNFNPVLIGVNDLVMNDTRKPLAAHFKINDTNEDLFLVNVHFNSKSGSMPLMGAVQPAVNGGEKARAAQAQLVNKFVKSILDLDPSADVIVLGDVNEFTPFPKTSDYPPWDTEDAVLLVDILLGSADGWSYVFQGNCQALDHVFASKSIKDRIDEVVVVHANNLFSENQQASDHDPIVFTIV